MFPMSVAGGISLMKYAVSTVNSFSSHIMLVGFRLILPYTQARVGEKEETKPRRLADAGHSAGVTGERKKLGGLGASSGDIPRRK